MRKSRFTEAKIIGMIKEQKTVYKLSHEQVHHNMALLKPGLGFRELAEKSWRIPDRFEEFEVGVIVHGIGMCNEYPHVAPLKWFGHTGYDGEFQVGRTVSVESYIGERGPLKASGLKKWFGSRTRVVNWPPGFRSKRHC